MEILATALTGNQIYSPSSMRSMTLQRVKHYILNNLQDYTLSPTAISENVGISIRYLHMLFEGENTTVNNWIKNVGCTAVKTKFVRRKIAVKLLPKLRLTGALTTSAILAKSLKKNLATHREAMRNR